MRETVAVAVTGNSATGIVLYGLQGIGCRAAAAGNAADGRHTHCLTAVVRVADGRRTMNVCA